LLTLSLLVASCGALASPADEARKCAALDSDAERLACYDRVFRQAPAAAKETAAATPAKAAKNPTDDFGYSDEQRAAQAQTDKEAKSEPPRELRAHVTKLSQKQHGEYVITLDNGQVWYQVTTDWRLVLTVGDEVVIRRGVSNSYQLRRADDVVFTKVRRQS
jgi:hypothetical protein